MDGIVVVPKLGMGSIPIHLSLWLVPTGVVVMQGDRIAELVIGNVVVDLESPANGVLFQHFVDEDEQVQEGQKLALVKVAP